MDLHGCRKLYAQMEWADALTWSRVLAHGPTADDSYVRDSLFHLHYVQRAYLAGWRGEPVKDLSVDDFPSIHHLRDWGQSYYPDAAAFLESLTNTDLQAPGGVLWPDLIEELIGQPPVEATLGDMVVQVASHGIHHRAQINRRIREVGGEPALIDYVAWIWLGSPAPDWISEPRRSS